MRAAEPLLNDPVPMATRSVVITASSARSRGIIVAQARISPSGVRQYHSAGGPP